MKPTLILVGADKGGVGKTTVSRSLLDFSWLALMNSQKPTKLEVDCPHGL